MYGTRTARATAGTDVTYYADRLGRARSDHHDADVDANPGTGPAGSPWMDAIDVHHHIIPDFYAAELRELGGSTVFSEFTGRPGAGPAASP